MAFLNRSVAKRNWQPEQQLPGFLNQLTGLVILTPHLGQVTVMVLSIRIVSLLGYLAGTAAVITFAMMRRKGLLPPS